MITSAKVSKVSSAEGKAAAYEILSAQKSVAKASSLAKSNKWDELRDLFDEPPLHDFEQNMMKVVGAEGLLAADDIKEIGTIRRYGLAADFMITAGAAKAELEGDDEGNVNSKEMQRLLALAAGSIAEITTILKNAKAVSQADFREI